MPYVQFLDNMYNDKNIHKVSLKASMNRTTSNGGPINSPVLRCYVANCAIGGEVFTHSAQALIRNRIDLRLAGFDVHIVQIDNPRVIGTNCVYTTNIIVDRVSKSNITPAKRLVDGVCWLLSFATLSPVACFSYLSPGRSSGGPVRPGLQCLRSTVDVSDGSIVRKFLEQTYAPYCRFRRTRRLNVIFDYLVSAEREPRIIDIQFLLAFITLESLKDTYAKSKKYHFISGRYRKGPTKNSQEYHFRELIEGMLKEVKMSIGLKRLIRFRNIIVHSGVMQRTGKSKLRIYARVHDLIREYLLRLLGYRGPYNSHSDNTINIIL
jgi:hypothetical protein